MIKTLFNENILNLNIGVKFATNKYSLTSSAAFGIVSLNPQRMAVIGHARPFIAGDYALYYYRMP